MMKKLIAAMMVSLMVLGVLSGCGQAKGFDGDIFTVISVDMSKEEILKNAEGKFGSIAAMSDYRYKPVDNPQDANHVLYQSEYYGYPGNLMFTFDGQQTLQQICLSYENFEGDARQQYEDILSQFSEIYGQPYEAEYGTPMIDVGEWSIDLGYEYYSYDGSSGIYIHFAPKEDFFV